MKKITIALALSSLFNLTACNQQPAQQAEAPNSAEIAPEPVRYQHGYSLKDGFEYGYEQAISQDLAEAGQAATTLMMFKYAGKKDGVYQAYNKDVSGAISVMQCANPCDFIKIMVFYGGEHVNTQRMKATEGTIGWLVMADAINGELEQYVHEKNGKKSHVWFDEQKGLQTTSVDN